MERWRQSIQYLNFPIRYDIAGDSFEEADTLPTSRIWPRVSDILSREISNMATGDDVEKSLDKAADDVEKLLDSEGYYDK